MMKAVKTLIGLWVSSICQTQAALAWLVHYAVSWVVWSLQLPWQALRSALWMLDTASELVRMYILREPTPQQQVRCVARACIVQGRRRRQVGWHARCGDGVAVHCSVQ